MRVLRSEGWSYAEIARHFECSDMTVSRACDPRQLEKHRQDYHSTKRLKGGRRPTNPRVPEATKAKARELRAQGLTYREISEQLGISKLTARTACDPEALANSRAAALSWKSRNYDRALETTRAHARANRQRHREYAHQYRQTKPEVCRNNERLRRARKVNAPTDHHTPAQLREHLATFNGHCAYCLKAIPEGDLHLDHIEPLARGGAHALENLVPACSKCNLTKHSKTLLELLQHAQAQ